MEEFINNININKNKKSNYDNQILIIKKRTNIDISNYKHIDDVFNTNLRHKELAMVGDSYLSLINNHIFYIKNNSTKEMDNFRQTKLTNSYLSKVCRNIFEQDLYNIVSRQSELISDKMAATFIEALIGAMYINNEPNIKEFIMNIFN